MFSVRADLRHRLLRVDLSGFWDEAVMMDYMAAVRGGMRRLIDSGGCRRVLIDMTGFAVQTKAIAEAHANNLRAVRAMDGVRVALVMQDGLSKLQARRVAQDTGHFTFNSDIDALRWLLSDAGAPGSG